METSFQEFLEQKAEEYRLMPDIQQIKDEWTAAIGRLYGQIAEWVRELDPRKFIEIRAYDDLGYDSKLGQYRKPTLKLALGREIIDLEPMGRFAVGGRYEDKVRMTIAGRVDLRSTRHERVVLYRTIGVEDGRESWQVEGRASDRLEPFDRAKFESILLDLWS